MADKFVNRAGDIVMTVAMGPTITKDSMPRTLPEECHIFTLTDRTTGAFVQLDQFQLAFLTKQADYEVYKSFIPNENYSG